MFKYLFQFWSVRDVVPSLAKAVRFEKLKICMAKHEYKHTNIYKHIRNSSTFVNVFDHVNVLFQFFETAATIWGLAIIWTSGCQRVELHFHNFNYNYYNFIRYTLHSNRFDQNIRIVHLNNNKLREFQIFMEIIVYYLCIY